MNRRAVSPRKDNLRRALAQEAARIMAQHGIHDFLTAKRKAAERLGVQDASALPRNTEIEAALVEYQRLFDAGGHELTLTAQRRAALHANIRHFRDGAAALRRGLRMRRIAFSFVPSGWVWQALRFASRKKDRHARIAPYARGTPQIQQGGRGPDRVAA